MTRLFDTLLQCVYWAALLLSLLHINREPGVLLLVSAQLGFGYTFWKEISRGFKREGSSVVWMWDFTDPLLGSWLGTFTLMPEFGNNLASLSRWLACLKSIFWKAVSIYTGVSVVPAKCLQNRSCLEWSCLCWMFIVHWIPFTTACDFCNYGATAKPWSRVPHVSCYRVRTLLRMMINTNG